MSMLEINGTSIPYRVVKSKGRRISLRFSLREALLEIRTPSGRFSQSEQMAIRQNHAWILQHYEEKRGLWQRREAFIEDLAQGKGLYLGQPIRVEVHDSDRGQVRMDEAAGILHLSLSPAWREQPLAMALYQGLRTIAKHELKYRVQVQAHRTQLAINQVRVKDVTSRWGSCSEKRNVNLNWHLILLKPELIDYLIIHELMHLYEMNHGPRFWQWVEKYCPDYKRAEAELTQSEWLIGVFDQWMGQ
jgi:hypothetical protein